MADLKEAIKERLAALKAMKKGIPIDDETPLLTKDDIKQSLIRSKILLKNGKERQLIRN